MRFVRSVFIPEDETCLCVYQASSVEDVREAARRAQLPSERVVEAITESKGKG